MSHPIHAIRRVSVRRLLGTGLHAEQDADVMTDLSEQPFKNSSKARTSVLTAIQAFRSMLLSMCLGSRNSVGTQSRYTELVVERRTGAVAGTPAGRSAPCSPSHCPARTGLSGALLLYSPFAVVVVLEVRCEAGLE